MREVGFDMQAIGEAFQILFETPQGPEAGFLLISLGLAVIMTFLFVMSFALSFSAFRAAREASASRKRADEMFAGAEELAAEMRQLTAQVGRAAERVAAERKELDARLAAGGEGGADPADPESATLAVAEDAEASGAETDSETSAEANAQGEALSKKPFRRLIRRL